MKYLKKIGISLLYMISLILFLTFLITILSYFNLLNSHILTITELLILFVSLLIGGLIVGKKSNKNGWLEGLKLGLIFLLIIIILNFLFIKENIGIKNVLFYCIIISTITFGSMIGIQKK